MTQRRGSSPKRGTRWIDTNLTGTITSGGVTNLSLLGGLGLDDIPGLTVVRTLITLTVHAAAAAIGFGSQLIFVGTGIATGDAFSAAALPDLINVSEEPVRGWVFKTTGVVGVNPTEEEFGFIYRLEGDFRSMRKLDLDTEYFIQIHNAALAGPSAFTVQFGGLVRVLVKLP